MHFFCSEEHGQLWRSQHPDERGFVIDFEQSARACHAFFGDLLEVLER